MVQAVNTRYIRLNQFLVVFFVLFSSIGYSQNYHFSVEYITKREGLSNTEITSIVQDKHGFIWIGTQNGLNKYDGYSVKVYQNISGDHTSLCDNNITALLVDSRGDLWVGTENNGISVYDRNTDRFVNYTYHPLVINSLSNQFVTAIKEDSKGNIWVGSSMGLSKYQRKSKDFKRYLRGTNIVIEEATLDSLAAHKIPDPVLDFLKQRQHIKNNYVQFCAQVKSSFSNNSYLDHILKFARIEHHGVNIRAIEIDDEDNLWVGFENDSIGKYNPMTDDIEIHDIRTKNSKPTGSIRILSLCWSDAQLWIGTKGGGIIRYDSRTRIIRPSKNEFNTKFIKCITRDSQGKIWMGNDEGLNLYDRKSDTFQRFNYQDEFDEKLLSADVSSILEDNQGNYWVASYQGGINLLKKNQSFDHYKFHDDIISPSGSKSVSAVLEDSEGNIWIGYFTSGIDLFLQGSKRKMSFDPFKKSGLGRGTVFKIFEDSKKNIWVGTYEGGLQQYDKISQKFVSCNLNTDRVVTDVRGICEDINGNLWVAAHGMGIEKLNYKRHSSILYRADYVNVKSSLASDWVSTVFCDSKGRIWTGSASGLSVFEPDAKHFITYNTSNSNLSHNKVLVILEDNAGRVWVGTENGLNLFDNTTRKFKIFTTNQGLVNNFISGIRVDAQGVLWIGTYNGLSRFDFDKGTIKNYLNNSGLQATEFSVGACANGKDDRIYFGAKNGLISFYPSLISYNPVQPAIIITDFKLFNKSVPISDDANAILTKQISETKAVVLPHDQNVISFEFTAINYVDPKQNTYAYMLEGFENDWNYVGTQRAATYTNLDPGHYTFRVKAANNDGIWNSTGTSVEITIKPPLWLTGWAKAVYIILFLLSSYFIRKALLSRIRLRHKLELDEMKLRFFANISHELRTPLTLILGPVQQLGSTHKINKKDTDELLNMLLNNGNKLLRLVNQLMNIYEVDAGVMKLKVSEGNVIAFTRKVFDTFCYYAERRNIFYTLSFNVAELTGFFDADKLETILSNIIGNAFKYSTDYRSIEVVLSLLPANACTTSGRLGRRRPSYRMVEISIADKGKGISPTYQKKIFERFFRIEEDNQLETGTGIGLSLAMQLAHIHKGDIVVNSKVGEGSVFTIQLPIDKGAYDDSEISLLPITENQSTQSTQPHQLISYEAPEQKDEEAATGKDALPILVIIDDNEDIRQYIRYCFKSEFLVIDVEDGEEGLEKVFEVLPDIVICDVMLPGINGIDVCATLKRDWRTSHVPVILLTAKIGEAHQLRGLKEGGADDYVTKPFNVNLLSIKIKNILSYRKRLRQVLQIELQCQTKDVGSLSADDNFVKKAIAVVESHIDDLDFNVEMLGKELGLSQTNLYRKLQGVVGFSANQFIKNIRLKKAAQILELGENSVTEVAFMVGFADAKYFSKTFKKQFGMLPKEYSKFNAPGIQNIAQNSLN